jgi:pre-mRNA-splicing factor 18
LFGETDKERRLRLRALELIEERGGDKISGQNDFRKALEDVEDEEKRKLERAGIATRDRTKQRDPVETKVDLSLLKADPNKLYPVIYAALKQTLADWGQWMDERPGAQHAVLFLLLFLIYFQTLSSAPCRARWRRRRRYNQPTT